MKYIFIDDLFHPGQIGWLEEGNSKYWWFAGMAERKNDLSDIWHKRPYTIFDMLSIDNANGLQLQLPIFKRFLKDLALKDNLNV